MTFPRPTLRYRSLLGTLVAVVAGVALSASSAADATVVVEKVRYTDSDKTVLEGILAIDDAIKGKRPGVLVVHDWMGVGTGQPEEEVKALAALGYVAFAADIYGKGVAPKDGKEAGALAGKYKSDRPLMQRRAQAGLKVLQEHARVDVTKLGAMGFCFGGTVAIELAKSGADIDGAVSFHGGLDAAVPGASKKIKGSVLALHGAADPFVPAKDLAAFKADLDGAKVDWQLVEYSGAVHAFTNPKAGDDPTKGAAYNALAAARSKVAMKAFFAEVFARP